MSKMSQLKIPMLIVFIYTNLKEYCRIMGGYSMKKKKNMSIVRKVSLSTLIIMIVLIGIIVSIGYKVISNQYVKSAGMELVGCANITLGLIDSDMVGELIDGNTKHLTAVEESLDWTTQQKPIFDSSYIITKEGKLLALGNGMEKRGYKPGDTYYINQDVMKTINSTKQPFYTSLYTFNGEEKQTGYAPIFNQTGEIIAYNAIDFDKSILHDRTWTLVKKIVLLLSGPMLIGMLVLMFIVRNIMKPLKELSIFSKRVADGDLTAEPLAIKNNDEIGQLTQAMNEMLDGLKDVIQNVSFVTGRVANQSKALNQSASEVKEGSEQVASTMEQLSSGVEVQANSASNLSEMMENFLTKIKEANKNGEEVSDASRDVLSMTEEGGQLMLKSVNQMNSIDSIVKEAVTKVQGLDKQSQEISKLVQVIHDIAEQTNLLSLNAAIEAARAGEHGKGFAVVADEVRKLSEQVSTSIVDITNIVTNIQRESGSVVKSLEAGYQEVDEGTKQITVTGKTFKTIYDSVSDMVAKIQNISAHLQDIDGNSDDMNRSIEEVASISQESAAGVEQVSASVQQQSGSMEEVSNTADELAKLAGQLSEQVRRFKL